jgi:uncharacterized membrane protein YfcA
MTDIAEFSLIYIALGFGVGLLVGLTGVGGGSLMTPILILLLGVPPPAAVGTDLLYACVTKTGGVIVHGLNGNVDWRVVGCLSAGSLPAAAITLFLLHFLNIHSDASNALFSGTLGVALLLTSVVLVFRRQFVELYGVRIGRLDPRRLRLCTITVGAALGFLVSISSVGAGALGATALILLYPELPTTRIAGSDIAHAVPLTLVAGLGHLLLGTIDVALLIALLLGSLPGIFVGSALVTKIPERFLRFTLAGVLALVAIRLVGFVIW